MDLDEAEKSQSMILESINMEASGFFISIDAQVVASAIVALGKKLILNDQDEYNNRKQELKNIAKEESVEVDDRVEVLIQRWDNLARIRENPRALTHIIVRKIPKITNEMTKLQGTQHINIFIDSNYELFLEESLIVLH